VVFPKTLCSALALLVPWISADHADNALAADDLAVAANFLDRSRNSHVLSPKTICVQVPEQLLNAEPI
jgi:hypothetical protein